MMQEFGGIIRAMMGSGMQVAEQAQRRSHMSQMEAQAQFERERGLAEMLRRDLSSPTFWKSAGSEAVADRMTYASELAGRHDAASQAFMTGADRIRNQYGINVEDINRDHPGSAVERHHALRDALMIICRASASTTKRRAKSKTPRMNPTKRSRTPSRTQRKNWNKTQPKHDKTNQHICPRPKLQKQRSRRT